MGFDFVIPMSALKAASESVQAHERLVYELKNEGNTKGRSELSLSVVLWYSPYPSCRVDSVDEGR